MAGVGVIFRDASLTRRIARGGWFNEALKEPNLGALLDLVALGTVADVVKLDHNNRILVDQGLRRMRENKLTPGLRALFSAAGRDPKKATSLDLGFIVGPRLNANKMNANYSNGNRHGQYKEYYDNGQLIVSVTYFNGEIIK